MLPQRGDTLGDRMRNVFADLFGRGYSSAVMVGSDLPTLPPAHVEQAFDCLHNHRSSVVIGPATDGGYYLIGLCRLWPQLFDSIPWSTPYALRATVEAAENAHLIVSMMPEWYDVDEIDELRLVLNETAGAGRTRSWAATHSELTQTFRALESSVSGSRRPA